MGILRVSLARCSTTAVLPAMAGSHVVRHPLATPRRATTRLSLFAVGAGVVSRPNCDALVVQLGQRMTLRL